LASYANTKEEWSKPKQNKKVIRSNWRPKLILIESIEFEDGTLNSVWLQSYCDTYLIRGGTNK